MSKNANLFPFSTSVVNFILLWKLFNDSITWLIRLELTKQRVSSAYLFYNDLSLDNERIIFCSSSTIKTRPIVDPMATPSTCTYVFLFRVKWAVLVQRYSSPFIYYFGMLMLISFLSYILLSIILSLLKEHW